MAVTNVNEQLIKELVSSNLPAKIRPEYIPKEQNQTPLSTPKITEWELYNDITANIWHNESTSIQAKQAQYNTLHTIMPLQVK